MFNSLEKRQKRDEVFARAKAIKAAADNDPKGKRSMTAEENKNFDDAMDECDRLRDEIKREERAEKTEADLVAPLQTPFHEIRHGHGAPGSPIVAPLTKEQLARARECREFIRKGGTGVMEFRALQADSETAGGALFAREQFVNRLIKFVDDELPLRSLCTVVPLSNSDSIGVPTLEADPADADWTSELATGTADSTMSFGKRGMTVHPLAKSILVSNKLVRTAGMDVEGFVAQRLAYKFAVTFEKALISGTGVQQPLGAFVANANGVPTSRDTTTTASAAIKADDLLSAMYSVKQQYMRKGVWVMGRDTLAAVRKLKDSNNNYIYSINQQAQSSMTQPAWIDTLFGRPVVVSEYCPAYSGGAGTYVAVFADWSQYWFIESMAFQLQKLVELYAATNQIGFIGRMEVDGAPVLSEAFARLKLSA